MGIEHRVKVGWHSQRKHFGKVRWYNPEKGFGFIEGSDLKEYFVHVTRLSAELQRAAKDSSAGLKKPILCEGQLVLFDIAMGDRGPMASDVSPIEELFEDKEESVVPGTAHALTERSNLIVEIRRPETAQTLIERPKLVVEISRKLVPRIAMEPEMLRRISPREFEELMAEVFSTFGYDVELTAPSHDGGVDIRAVRTDHGIVSKLLIECKRYIPPNKVDVGLVRQLYAVKQMEHASKGLLVTTSYFTRAARELERRYLYELELKDFDAVTEWVKEHSQFYRRI